MFGEDCRETPSRGPVPSTWSSARTVNVSIGTAPAWTMRASVRSVAILDQFPEASMMQKTLYPASTALSAGRHADTRESAGNKERSAPGPLDGLDPLGVVPGVDLARPRNVNRVGLYS